MSEVSPLRAAVHQRFRAAFGEPHRTVGQDSHWALRSLGYIAAINVLVDGGPEHPTVWVFDPHDPRDGVSHAHIRSEAEIDPIVARIEKRVKEAGRTLPR